MHRWVIIGARRKSSNPRLKKSKLSQIVSSSIAPIPVGRLINDYNDGWAVIGLL